MRVPWVLAGVACLLAGVPAQAQAPKQGGENPWIVSGRAAVARARGLASAEKARNVVIFVGDGMGLSTITAARILEGQFRGDSGEENLLAFETLPHVALTKTYNTNQQVPDSAGTITALLAGVKTRAGVINVDETVARGDAAGARGHEVRTLFEEAETRGLATGVVSTARITHATAAGAFAHVPNRSWENDTHLPPTARELDFPDIARQLVEWPVGDGFEVVLGGGRAHFLPASTPDPEHRGLHGNRADGRNLIDEWQAKAPGARFVWDAKGFASVDPVDTKRLLGLFEPEHMLYEIDRAADTGGEPSLAEMTRTALAMLSRDSEGFVLLVEGGRIDHGHHLNNAHRALVDTVALSDAVRVAQEHASAADTLIVVTADHGHVLSIAGYPTRGNPILGKVVLNDERGAPRAELARDLEGHPYTTLGYQNGPGYRIPRPDLTDVDTTSPTFRQETAVPLRTETHSGEDIPVYAGGPGAHLFHGVQEQSYVYHAMRAALGWDQDDAGGVNAAPDAAPPSSR